MAIKLDKDEAILMIADSETDSNLYYATRFLAPDAFIFIETKGKRTLVMSDLEVDRARSQAEADEVASYSEISEKLRENGTPEPKMVDVIDSFLRDRGVRRLLVPGNFAFRHAESLRERGYTLGTKADPFFEARDIKTPEEIRAITETQRATEEAVEAAHQVLREAEIKGDEIHWNGEVLTAEAIKKIINVKLMELECVAQHTIIACGIQGCDPHNEG
ncbi:MAG TPA: aminopeptidase P family protein, partial [Nitrospiria bacterium]